MKYSNIALGVPYLLNKKYKVVAYKSVIDLISLGLLHRENALESPSFEMLIIPNCLSA